MNYKVSVAFLYFLEAFYSNKATNYVGKLNDSHHIWSSQFLGASDGFFLCIYPSWLRPIFVFTITYELFIGKSPDHLICALLKEKVNSSSLNSCQSRNSIIALIIN